MMNSNNNIDFGVTGENYKSKQKYDYSKKVVAYCQSTGKPIRDGDSYLETPEGVILLDDKQVLIEYYNLHRVTQYAGETIE